MKRILTMLIAAMLLSACGGLSSKEKQIVGLYYNPAVSDREPVFELNGKRDMAYGRRHIGHTT